MKATASPAAPPTAPAPSVASTPAVASSNATSESRTPSSVPEATVSEEREPSSYSEVSSRSSQTPAASSSLGPSTFAAQSFDKSNSTTRTVQHATQNVRTPLWERSREASLRTLEVVTARMEALNREIETHGVSLEVVTKILEQQEQCAKTLAAVHSMCTSCGFF